MMVHGMTLWDLRYLRNQERGEGGRTVRDGISATFWQREKEEKWMMSSMDKGRGQHTIDRSRAEGLSPFGVTPR